MLRAAEAKPAGEAAGATDAAGLDPAGDESARVAADSLAISLWTVVSRVTGFGRLAVIAAVLGPTYLGNTFQATNQLPNLTFEFLTGSLFATLLVPALVRHVDGGQSRQVERLAGSFLGLALVGFGALSIALVVAGPLLLGVLTLGVGDPAVAADQRAVGWLLLALLMPQVLLYAVAYTGAAVMNAHGRFALPAAAPSLENVGIIATLAASALLFGTGADVEDVSTGQLLLLGLGTTAAVGLHAAVQWWGARRSGVTLIPRTGWRDPELRGLIGMIRPSLGYSGLNILRVFAVLVVANSVAGGVVAFMLAMQLLYLPVNAGTRPIAVALLPRLSRLFHSRALQGFRDQVARGTALALFLTIPVAAFYLVLAEPIARAVSFGGMSQSGFELVAISLAALAPGVVAEASFVFGTHASYALHDARSPFRAMTIRTAVSIAVMAVAFGLQAGMAVLFTLGVAVSLGNVLGAWSLNRRILAALPEAREALWPSVARTLAAAAIMAVAVYAGFVATSGWVTGDAGELAGVLLAALFGGAVFIAAQRLWGSPELDFFAGGVRALRPGAAR